MRPSSSKQKDPGGSRPGPYCSQRRGNDDRLLGLHLFLLLVKLPKNPPFCDPPPALHSSRIVAYLVDLCGVVVFRVDRPMPQPL